MNFKKLCRVSVSLLFAGVYFTSGSALADIIFTTGVGITGSPGNQDTENVLLISDLGNDFIVTGTTNQTGELVIFESNELIRTQTTGGGGVGQARIVAVDGQFDLITITLNDDTMGYEKIIFNIDAAQNGPAIVSFVNQFGQTESFNITLGNGENFFTALGTAGQVIVSTTIDSTVPITSIANLQQVRLGPTNIPTNNVPEPNTLLLIGLGLLGASVVRRKTWR